jgi:hypothetical protein
MHQREICLAQTSTGKHFGERLVGAVVLGDDDQAAGFFVEPMHDARAKLAGRGRKRLKVMQQRVHERSLVAGVFSCAGAGVNHHAGGFVDYREIGVLEEYVERNLLRNGAQRRRMGLAGDRDRLAPLKFVGSLGLLAVDDDSSLVKQQPYAGAAEAIEPRYQKMVETETRLGRRDLKNTRLRLFFRKFNHGRRDKGWKSVGHALPLKGILYCGCCDFYLTG